MGIDPTAKGRAGARVPSRDTLGVLGLLPEHPQSARGAGGYQEREEGAWSPGALGPRAERRAPTWPHKPE